MSYDKSEQHEAVEAAAQELTTAEVAFVERKPSSRVRCTACRRFHFKVDGCRCGYLARPYQPDVDGTLGGQVERRIGGPRKVTGIEVDTEDYSPVKTRLGGPQTVYPTGQTNGSDEEVA